MDPVERAIRELKAKKTSIEQGQAPPGAGVEQPSTNKKILRQDFETQEAYARAIEPEIKPIEMDAGSMEDAEEIDRLEQENERLKNLLRKTALHVGARNAIGEKSTVFCSSCNNARHEDCVLPEIWKAVG